MNINDIPPTLSENSKVFRKKKKKTKIGLHVLKVVSFYKAYLS